MTLSIIIPAFDEENKIARDVQEAARFLVSNGISGEIIVVDDGSSDQTSVRANEAAHSQNIPVRILRYETHRGKGFAVQTGITTSHGEYVMFADSGLTVPYSSSLAGLQLLQEGRCEIAHGSRKLPGSIIHKRQDWDRTLISLLFHQLVVHWLNVPSHLTDTQCGFKLYRGETGRTLFQQCTTPGFLFDIEMILLATREGYRIEEFPVAWSCDRDSRISLRRSSMGVLREIHQIKRMFSIR